jgi:hypothetical protein
MRDNYDFSKMRKVPHPLLGKAGKLTDNVGGISDEEFKRKLQDLEQDERDIAIRLRKRWSLNTNVTM